MLIDMHVTWTIADLLLSRDRTRNHITAVTLSRMRSIGRELLALSGMVYEW